MRTKVIPFLLISLFWFNAVSASDIICWKQDADSLVMDRITVQKIFTKKVSRWPDGQRINVFVKPLNSIEHRDFVVNVLRISPFYFQQQLEEQTFSGKSVSVTEVSDDNTMIRKIESTPGAIGYVNYTLYKGSREITIIDVKGNL